MNKSSRIAAAAALAAIFASPAIADPHEGADTGITLPEGFSATVFADDIGPVRHIAVRDDGTVYGMLYRQSGGGGIVAALWLTAEPAGKLDRRSGQEIVSSMEELNRQGLTLIIVTHDPAIGGRSRRQIRMEDGRIVADEAS